MSDLLQCYLSDELKDDRGITTINLILCREVLCGENDSFADYGNEFNLYVENQRVKLERGESKEQFALSDFCKALSDWQSKLLQNVPLAIKDFYQGILDDDNTIAATSCAKALPELEKYFDDLYDTDSIILFQAYLKLANNQMQEEALLASSLIIKLAKKFSTGTSPNFLLQLAQEYQSQKNSKQALLLIEEAAYNHNERKVEGDPNHKHFSKHLLENYLEILKSQSKEQHLQFEEFYSTYIGHASEIGRLNLGLYKACSLYNEYRNATGMAQSAEQMLMMMRGLTSNAMVNPEHSFISKPMSMDQLHDLLKSRILINAEATGLYKQFIKHADEIESEFGKLKAENESVYPELCQLIEDDIEKALNMVQPIRIDENTQLDFGPTSDNDLQEDYLYDDVAIKIDEAANFLSKLKQRYPADIGSPNAEPIILWKHLKFGLLIGANERLARKLAQVVMNFIDYFHADKNSSLKKTKDDLIVSFASEPKFLNQCFAELVAFYDAAGMSGSANNFKNVDLSNVVVTKESKVACTVLIYIPLDIEHHFENLNFDVPMAIVTQQIDWEGSECTEPEYLEEAPGKAFKLMTIITKDPDGMIALCKNVIVTSDAARSIIFKTGKVLN